MAFLAHDIIVYSHTIQIEGFVKPTSYDLLAWSLLFVIGIGAGLSYDRTADHREALTLYENKQLYVQLLTKASKSWPDGQKTQTTEELRRYARWLITRIAGGFLFVAILLLILRFIVGNAS